MMQAARQHLTQGIAFGLFCSLIYVLVALPANAQTEDPDAIRHAEAVQLLINDGEFENAIARAEAALKQHKNSQRLQLQRGLILVKLDRLKAAASHYKKLMRRFKNNPEPGNNLAMVYRFQKRYGIAIETFRENIRRFPEYPGTYENLGDTYIEMGNLEYQTGNALFPELDSLQNKADTSGRFDEIASGTLLEERDEMLARIEEGQRAIDELETMNASVAAQSATLSDPTDIVLATLESWVNAWSDRNIDLYIAHYGLDFVPEKDLGIEDWIAQRSAIMERAEEILVELEDVKISRTEVNQVLVDFVQRYQSNLLKTVARKSLTMRRYDDGKWLITREESRPLN